MKNVDRADQYLSYCTILKIIKMEQKGCTLAHQLGIIQFLPSVQVAEPRIEIKVQNIST
jgi:hypothetical protein